MTVTTIQKETITLIEEIKSQSETLDQIDRTAVECFLDSADSWNRLGYTMKAQRDIDKAMQIVRGEA